MVRVVVTGWVPQPALTPIRELGSHKVQTRDGATAVPRHEERDGEGCVSMPGEWFRLTGPVKAGVGRC